MWVRIRQSRAAVARIISSYDFIFGDIVGGRPARYYSVYAAVSLGLALLSSTTVGDHRGGLVRVDKDVEKVFGFLFQLSQPACEIGGVFLLRSCCKPEP